MERVRAWNDCLTFVSGHSSRTRGSLDGDGYYCAQDVMSTEIGLIEVL